MSGKGEGTRLVLKLQGTHISQLLCVPFYSCTYGCFSSPWVFERWFGWQRRLNKAFLTDNPSIPRMLPLLMIAADRVCPSSPFPTIQRVVTAPAMHSSAHLVAQMRLDGPHRRTRNALPHPPGMAGASPWPPVSVEHVRAFVALSSARPFPCFVFRARLLARYLCCGSWPHRSPQGGSSERAHAGIDRPPHEREVHGPRNAAQARAVHPQRGFRHVRTVPFFLLDDERHDGAYFSACMYGLCALPPRDMR